MLYDLDDEDDLYWLEELIVELGFGHLFGLVYWP